MPTSEEDAVKCRGVNGSVTITKDGMRITGAGLAAPEVHEIPYSDVSAVVVERKSFVPVAILTFIAAIAVIWVNDNPIWLIVNLTSAQYPVTAIALPIAIISGALMVLRLTFVDVTIRSTRGPITLRLVPTRSGKRLARRFSQASLRS